MGNKVSSTQRLWARSVSAIGGAVGGLIGGGWKQILLRILILGALAGTGALIYTWAGLAPISAKAGHTEITRWFLHFAMRKAVETRSASLQAPELDDLSMVLKGAGHYATGCAPCHGAPGQAPSLVARNMTPQPPLLIDKIDEWTPEQLFWIVKNGVKFTAMPAWPSATREDEVWAMVAFLDQMPELSPEQYLAMAYGEAADGRDQDENSPSRSQETTQSQHQHSGLTSGNQNPDHLKSLEYPIGSVLENCVRCHGERGIGRGTGAFPKIAGQNEAYLLANLSAYARGTRYSGIMQPIAAALDEETLAALAQHYSRQPAFGPAGDDLDPESIKKGRGIVFNGLPAKGVPSCRDCHGPTAADRNPLYPQIAGQYADYLFLQLKLFKKNQRGETPYSDIMHVVTKRLTEEEMRHAAAYYASLEGEPALMGIPARKRSTPD